MARHRNVRAMDPDEEYEGYYSCYGHSVEDEFCISPRTEAQFLYDRNAEKHSMSSFLVSQPETEAEYNSEDSPSHGHNKSYEKSSNLSDMDKAKMQSCVEAIQDVVGDTVSEVILKRAAIDHSFDLTKALNAVLSGVYSTSQEDTAFRDGKNSNCGKKEKQQDQLNKLSSDVSCLKISTASSSENKDCLLKRCARPRELDFKDGENSSGPTENVNNIEKFDESTSENSYSTKSSTVKKDALTLYEKDRANNKPLLNLVVIGHVDAGKSTLMGHMLYSLGFVPKKAMHKYESESKKLGKASFMYAWVLDETSEERNRGITMDVAQSKFDTPNKTINLLDAPGHKDFIPNMIAGASQADVAILVVDATRGEFETGFETGGQTREHTMLIRSLGVSQLGVAVNKMDNVSWSKQRYDSIVNKLSVFLKQVGFKENDVQFVPCSGLTGENLIKPVDASDDSKKWYEGPTLINVIDSFKAPQRAVSKPFRMCVSDVFKGMGSGFCVAGRIEAGCIQNGDKVLIMPAGEQAVVRGVTVGESTVHHSFAGDHAILQIISVDMNILTGGSIICDPNVPVKVSSKFQARLVILNITVPITKGFPVILHYQSLTEQAVIKKLISQLHRSSGELLRKHPRCLAKNSSAVVEIEVSRPICLELYREFKELGRFMLRSGGATIAAGLVTEIL